MSIRSCEFACFTKGLHLVRHCAAWGKALISVRRPSFCKFSSSLQHIILQGSTGVKPLRCERKLIGGLVDVGNECKGQIQAWKQAGNLTNFAGQVPLQRRPCHAGSLFHHSKRILQRRSEKWRCSGIAGPKKGEKMIEHEMYCWFEYLLWNIIIIIWRCGESSKWPARCASSFQKLPAESYSEAYSIEGQRWTIQSAIQMEQIDCKQSRYKIQSGLLSHPWWLNYGGNLFCNPGYTCLFRCFRTIS